MPRSMTVHQTMREGNDALKRALGLAIERGRTDVVEKYLDFAASVILLDIEPIERWRSRVAPEIETMTRRK